MADAIDPDGPEPVYRQVAAIIAARIRSGRLAADRPIPSETQMTQEFGIARGTARKAVALLRDEGLVRTVMGRGTYVLPQKPSGDS
jgi:DNA-binding GntR family transcriptional regulator